MTPRDVDDLARRLRSLERSAGRIRDHVEDLHAVAYEPVARNSEPDRTGFESRPPPGWKPEPNRAQDLWAVLVRVAANSEAAIVELERQMMAVFFAGTSTPAPSRGSLISAADHDELLARQRARTSTARLVDQPTHPSAGR